MKNPFYILLLAFCFIAFINTDCKHNPVGPETIQPGRRDYTWTFDTLHLQLGSLESIWGSSPADIWACGNEDLFHYDGTKWIRYTDYSGYSRRKLFGFSANDMWLGGSDGNLWHYDGTNWTEKYKFTTDNIYNACIDDIEGTSSNNLYAVGYFAFSSDINSIYGFLLHYDGSNWSEIYRANHVSEFGKIKIDNGAPFVYEYKLSSTHDMGNDSISFYQLMNNHSLKLLYTNNLNTIIWGNIYNIGDRVYFVISHDVYRYGYLNNVTGTFVKYFSFPEQDFGYQVYGRSEKDVFVPIGSGISHYNGTDVQPLINFSNTSVSIVGGDPAIFDNDVFFGLYDGLNGVNMILHGKLKQ
jgi:hypothetical protein